MVSEWDGVCLVANTPYPSPLTGEIAAIVIAGVFVLALVIIVVVFFVLCCTSVSLYEEGVHFHMIDGQPEKPTFNPMKNLLSRSVGVHIYSAHNFCTAYGSVHDFTFTVASISLEILCYCLLQEDGFSLLQEGSMSHYHTHSYITWCDVRICPFVFYVSN